jgi:hypothetical protein
MRRRLRLAVVVVISMSALGAVSMFLGGGARSAVAIFLPLMMAVSGPLIVAIVFVAERKLRRRLRQSDCMLCTHCEYDLSGLPDGGTCPECGSPYIHAMGRAHWRATPLIGSFGVSRKGGSA